MKTLFIDDNTLFTKTLYKNLHKNETVSENESESLITPSKNEDLSDLSERVIMVVQADRSYIIFININFKTNHNTRQLQQGIELLIWLRLKGIMNHVVIYSFESLHSLLNRKPQYLIVTSAGTSFVQLPDDFDNMEKLLITKKNSNTFYAENENLKVTLKPAFSIEAIRHQEANWWGIKALWDAHKLKTYGSFSKEYPVIVQKSLASINNLIATFLYKTDKVTISDIIAMSFKELDNRKKVWQEKQIEEINTIPNILKNIDECVLLIEMTQDEVDRINTLLNDKEIVQNLLNAGQYDAKEFENLRTSVNKYTQDIDEYKIKKNELENELKNIDRLQKVKTEDGGNLSLKSILEKNFEGSGFEDYSYSKRTVLLIDDLSEKGWSETYTSVLGNKITIEVLPVNRAENTDYEAAKNNLIEKIHGVLTNDKEKCIMCVFLDLRIFKEDNHFKHVHEYTGSQLLTEIKRNYPYIPIIITTASNKLWTYSETKRIGADAYWNKEGIDNYFSSFESIDNYNKLRRIVFAFNRPEYDELRYLGNVLQTLKDNKTSFWWEEKEWEYPEGGTVFYKNSGYNILMETKVDRGNIIKEFSKGVKLFSLYLNGKYIEKTIDDNESHIYLSSLIVHFGKIIELLHPYIENGNLWIPAGTILQYRGDKEGYDLYNTRNKLAHSLKDISLNQFVSFIKKYSVYITSNELAPNRTLSLSIGNRYIKEYDRLVKSIKDTTKEKTSNELPKITPENIDNSHELLVPMQPYTILIGTIDLDDIQPIGAELEEKDEPIEINITDDVIKINESEECKFLIDEVVETVAVNNQTTLSETQKKAEVDIAKNKNIFKTFYEWVVLLFKRK